MKNKRKNYVLRVFRNKDKVDEVRTHSLHVFHRHLRTVISLKDPWRAYLRVSYGRAKDYRGQWLTFYNDGWYEDKDELLKSWNAFRES